MGGKGRRRGRGGVVLSAGVGAYQQSQLQTKAWQFIEEYIRTNSAYADRLSFQAPPATLGQPHPPVAGGPPPPVNLAGGKPAPLGAAPNTAGTCSNCGRPLREGARFCDNCGNPVAVTCPGCGKQLRIGARFCDECGAAIPG